MSTITYFDTLIDGINRVPDCRTLAKLKEEAMEIVQKAIDDALESIKALLPIIEIPGPDPAEIVAWITAFVEPVIAAYNKLIALQVLLLQKQAELVAAITNKISALSCTF